MIDKNDTLNELETLNGNLNIVSRRFQLSNVDKNDSIEEMCLEKDIDTDFFLEILKVFSDGDYFPEQQLKSFPMPVILDYLHKTHVFYLKTKLPEIENIMTSIEKHGSNTDLLSYLKNYFIEFKKELSEHIRQEEGRLFPYIQKLDEAAQNPSTKEDFVGSFNILEFEANHDDQIEDSIAELRTFIVRFCNDAQEILPYKMLLAKLSLLENDLRVHAIVENKVLIPKALELEKELVK